MRSITLATLGLLIAAASASHDHSVFTRRHAHLHDLFKRNSESKLAKRSGTCAFPKDKGLVAVTPDAENAGWAMSPDQPCKCGSYCPYACPPGQLMAQWNPDATSYSYPESMDGGLYCNKDGEVEIPFPDKPLCVDGVGSVSVENKAGGGDVAFCQTVLPGNEAMLIPTCVKQKATLAVPDTSYWAETAAHYYINAPGVSTEEACVWGTKDKPIGNWSPYVAGANAKNGETFVKLGWNPIYIEPDVKFRDEVPDFGVRIECDGPCNGLPCAIDPAKHKVNQCSQKNPTGAGGASFCVVGVPKGSKARIVVFGGSGDVKPKVEEEDDNEESAKDDEKEIVESSSSSYVAPSTKVSTPSKTTTSSSVSSSTAAPSTSSTAEETYSSSSSSSSSSSDYSLVYEVPSTTLEKVVVASVTGSSSVPTNGTVSYPSEAPTSKPEPTSSGSTAAIPSLALLFTIAYAVVSL